MHPPLSDDGNGNRSLGDTLEIVVNLIYLARMSETGSEKQKRFLDEPNLDQVDCDLGTVRSLVRVLAFPEAVESAVPSEPRTPRGT
jgi:hypothetical protein